MKDDISIGNYKLEKTIGSGTFGQVKLGIHNITLEKVAVKILEKSKISQMEDIERVKREILFLKKLNHTNVIKLLEILEDSTSIYMVMEYAGGGELFNHIVRKKKLNESEASFFFYQIVEGIESIHRNEIVHRDLKPENLLFNEHKQIKIIDFGLSNSYYDGGPYLKTPCGSPCYAAPEMVLGNEYSGVKVDTWSIGIILFAMTAGYLPFEDQSNERLFRKIVRCNLEFPDYVSKNSIEMIKLILNTDPETRISIKEIKNHDYYLQGKTLYFRHMRNRYSELYGHFKNSFIDSLGDPANNKNYYFLIRKQCEVLVRKFVLEKMVKDYKLKSADIQNSIDLEKHNSITATFSLLVNKYLNDNYLLEVLFDKEERKAKMETEQPSLSRKISGKMNELKLSISKTDSEEVLNGGINLYSNNHIKKESTSKSELKQSHIKSITKEIKDLKQSMYSAYNQGNSARVHKDDLTSKKQSISIIPTSKMDSHSQLGSKIGRETYSTLNTEPEIQKSKNQKLSLNIQSNSSMSQSKKFNEVNKHIKINYLKSQEKNPVSKDSTLKNGSKFESVNKNKSKIPDKSNELRMDTIESSHDSTRKNSIKLRATIGSTSAKNELFPGRANSKKFVMVYNDKEKASHDPMSHRENKCKITENIFKKEKEVDYSESLNHNTIEFEKPNFKTVGYDTSSGFYDSKKKPTEGINKLSISKQISNEQTQQSPTISQRVDTEVLRQSYDSKLLKGFFACKSTDKTKDKAVVVSPRAINMTQISTTLEAQGGNLNKSERVSTFPNEDPIPQNLLKMNLNKQSRPISKTINPILSQGIQKPACKITINQQTSKDKIRTISVIDQNKKEDKFENHSIHIKDTGDSKVISNLRLSQFNKQNQFNKQPKQENINCSIFTGSTPREGKNIIQYRKPSLGAAKSKSPPSYKPTLTEASKDKYLPVNLGKSKKIYTIDQDSIASRIAVVGKQVKREDGYSGKSTSILSIQDLENKILSLKAKKVSVIIL